MSEARKAQDRLLDDTQIALAEAIAALDKVQEAIEALDRAHLIVADDYWEALGALGGATSFLSDLRDDYQGRLQESL